MKMVPTDLLLTTTFLVLCMCTLSTATPRVKLTLVNKCPFTIWPAIHPHSGYPVLMDGAFALDTLANVSFPAFPNFTYLNHFWYGQIWARTGCTKANEHFSCATGDCRGQPDCSRTNISTPATMAQLQLYQSLLQDAFPSSYDVSLVHGFNVPITLNAHGVINGIKLFSCPTADCTANLLQTCPEEFKFRSPDMTFGPVVACKSYIGCGPKPHPYRGRDPWCKPSSNSEFFKSACPYALTNKKQEYQPSILHDCASLREVKIIFCN